MDVVLTSEGLAAIQAVAPGHVTSVRETFIDRLSAQDRATLDRLSAQDRATLDRLSATVIDGLHNLAPSGVCAVPRLVPALVICRNRPSAVALWHIRGIS